MTRRFQRLVTFTALVIVVYIVFVSPTGSGLSTLSFTEPSVTRGISPKHKGYDWVLELILQAKPEVKPLTKYVNDEKAKQKFVTDQDMVFSEEYLDNLLMVPKQAQDTLKKEHQHYVNSVLKDQHKSFHNELDHPSGAGIIFVGGGKFSWLAYLGIEQLRQLGCELPVEVFIGSEEDYEVDFCENILPELNARCSYLNYETGNIVEKLGVKINGYQYKNLAFLISKFEQILFLDADNAPLKDPTPLFHSEVMEKYGMVLWPDAWTRTTSPKYYDIAGLKVSDEVVRGRFKDSKEKLDIKKDVTYHDREGTLPNPSSESGTILVDKTKHVKTLLLSLYYNVFGPDLYYALLTQGAAGEGDKETFIAASTVVGTPHYQVLQKVRFIGAHYNGNFQSKALGQADPIQDYRNYVMGNHYDELDELVKVEGTEDASVEFMHMSYPKLIPFALLNNRELVNEDGGHIRMYGSITNDAGYDFELRMFELILGALCEGYDGPSSVSRRLLGLRLVEYKGRGTEDSSGQDMSQYCPQLIEHTEWLRKNPEGST